MQDKNNFSIHKNNHQLTKTETVDFKTPEEISSKEQSIEVKNESLINDNQKKRKFIKWHLTKKETIIASSVAVIAIGISSFFIYKDISHKVIAVSTSKPIISFKSKIINPNILVPSTLSGQLVPPKDNQRPITAVMIENTPYARPQSGLSQASVVFEALTEGGITRFMALYQPNLPTYLGPVRSLRPYFLDWAMGFNAPIAHVGGSPQALSEVNSLQARNLDYLLYPSYYQRISSRPAPHNVYTSLNNLLSLEASKGYNSSDFKGWPRQPAKPSQQPSVTSINFDMSYSTYNVSYQYDQQTNSYNRSEGGAPQIGANTNKQISPQVVIGLVVPWSQGSLDTSDAYYSVYQNIGSGEAYVFQDGQLTIGKWYKPSIKAPLSFTTNSGQPLKLIPGQTWITVIGSKADLTYN